MHSLSAASILCVVWMNGSGNFCTADWYKALAMHASKLKPAESKDIQYAHWISWFASILYPLICLEMRSACWSVHKRGRSAPCCTGGVKFTLLPHKSRTFRLHYFIKCREWHAPLLLNCHQPLLLTGPSDAWPPPGRSAAWRVSIRGDFMEIMGSSMQTLSRRKMKASLHPLSEETRRCAAALCQEVTLANAWLHWWGRLHGPSAAAPGGARPATEAGAPCHTVLS